MKTQLFKSAIFVGVLLVFFTACSQDDESTYRLTTKLVELNCKGTQSLQVTPALQGLSYTSLNTNIATVSPEGLITAKLVGTTKIVVKDSLNLFVDTVNVVVRSVNTLFDEPYFGFGINLATLKKELNLTEYSIFYPPIESGFKVIFEAKGHRWSYDFSSENKYTYVAVEVPEAEYTLLDAHLNDRYSLMTTKSYSTSSNSSTVDAYYINPDSSLIIEDYRYSHNTCSLVYFYQATQEKIQLVLSDETIIDLE